MAKGKAAVVEDDDVDDELEELEDEDDEVEEAPAKKSKKTAASNGADEVSFGAIDLAAYASKKLGREIKTKDLRALLRKMAREDKPRIDREVIPGNKSRYSWSGPEDPEVKRVLKALSGGEDTAQKKETLDKLKAKKAAEAAAKQKAAGKKGKSSKKAPVEEDDEDEDFEDE
jgi:hypothetical protein